MILVKYVTNSLDEIGSHSFLLLVLFQYPPRALYLLNILTLVDFSILRSQHLKDLIEVINHYEKDPVENNKLLQSYNPILTICLASDILIKVGNSRK